MVTGGANQSENLESWIGEYNYTAVFPHESGEINYVIDYNIHIYEEQGIYYAKIVGDGWQTQERTLALVEGDEEKIELIFVETLAEDIMYGTAGRYDDKAVLLCLENTKEGLQTAWHAMMHPVLADVEEVVYGVYFEKEFIFEIAE